MTSWLPALIGGCLIGLAVSVMLLFNGRVTGVSGIANGIFSGDSENRGWRIAFILGLFSAGLLVQIVNPALLVPVIKSNYAVLAIAGLLVGFGTVLGSGCTSGHGVCGLSRLSPRSLAATLVFMLMGMLTVWFLRTLGGGL